jgi:hypothetical protein
MTSIPCRRRPRLIDRTVLVFVDVAAFKKKLVIVAVVSFRVLVLNGVIVFPPTYWLPFVVLVRVGGVVCHALKKCGFLIS